MNPLLQPFDLPPFDRIAVADYEPAVDAALALASQRIEAIATNPEPPTFANTVEALETADRELQRVSAIVFNLNECCTSDELQAAVMRIDPKMTTFGLRVTTDRRLFERVRTVWNHWHEEAGRPTASPSLDTEQQTLLEETLKSFRRHGVELEGEAAERYKRNEEELTELKLRFSQNALADLNAWTLHLTDEADLKGLPDTVCAAARDEARQHHMEGWLFTLSAPSYIPFMTYSARGDLREKMYRAYMGIGNRGNDHDNNALIRRIVELRSEQARLLGYDTYCDYVLCDRMVRDLPTVQAFLQRMKEAVLPGARRDLAEVMDMKKSEAHGDEDFMPWDFSYYAERLKRQRYDLDEEQLRPYFALEAVREGIFALYGRLYGLRFTEDTTVPVYHPDVKVYRVTDGRREMGILYLDMHPRPSKRSGAWMTEFRGQNRAERPQIQVVCNFSKPTADTPSLLRFSEVETFMHEMGHAMHGMLSDVKYESLSGTNVMRDFVEMPSQVMENWCYEPEFLATFARHYQTGELLPDEYIEKIRSAQNHLAAWLCLRQLNLGFTDLAFHTLAPCAMPARFSAEQVEAAAMTNLLPRTEGCCTATNFGHIFSGGYASGYYGYKWAEVLDADIFSRFKHDGIFNRETAGLFRSEILSKGGSRHPALLFKQFMGRQPDQQALLRRMGIAV